MLTRLAAGGLGWAIVLGGLLTLSGCDTNSAPEEPAGAAARSETAPQDDADEREAPTAEVAEPEPADEGEVQVARAERPVEPPRQPARKPAQTEPPQALPASEAPLPLDNVDVAELSMPSVALTDDHAATCRVRVGDPFPQMELPNLEGEQQPITQLQGDRLTVVVFWNAQQPTALEELSDLARYYQPRFGDKGLNVVAINTGDAPQLASELAKQAGATYPVLTDADGSAFAKVAFSKLPRTYLLDAQGNVLWFDLEYSPTTRRDLATAIRHSLDN